MATALGDGEGSAGSGSVLWQQEDAPHRGLDMLPVQEQGMMVPELEQIPRSTIVVDRNWEPAEGLPRAPYVMEAEERHDSAAEWESDEEPERQCTICFGDDLECPGMDWCHPCRCRGTSRWVHKRCIMRWIDEKQKKKGLDSVVLCDQCRYPYKIHIPSPSILETVKAAVDSVLDVFSPYGAFMLGVGGFLYVSYKIGVVSCIAVAGAETTERWIEGPNSHAVNLGLTVSPMALMTFSLFKWDYYLMRCLLWTWARARYAARVLSQKIAGPKQDAANRLAVLVDADPLLNPASDNAGDPVLPDMDYSRMVMSSLALPFAAATCGQLLFPHKSWSTLHKSLLGGLTYFLVTGSVNVFCMLRSESRRKRREIEDFNG